MGIWGLRICLVGRIKKWEGRKWGRGWKSERIENIFCFLLCCLVGEVKKWRDKKLIGNNALLVPTFWADS